MMGPTLHVLSHSDTSTMSINYDKETDILSAKVLNGDDWDLGFNIDGCLVFDLNSHGMLSNVDCLIGRKRWSKKELNWPTEILKMGQLKFDITSDFNQLGETIDRTYSAEVAVNTSVDYKVIQILIGDIEGASEIVELAPNCLVNIQNDVLKGFWMRL